MSSDKTKYIINDIYDITVKPIVHTDVVHRVLYNIAMQSVKNTFIIVSHCYVSLISFFSYYLPEFAFIGYGFYFRREVVPYFNAMVKY